MVVQTDLTPYRRGRPMKYELGYAEMLKFHMEHGGSFSSFRRVINVSRATLYRWWHQHEDFRIARDEGESLALYHYEKLLRRLVMQPAQNRAKSRPSAPYPKLNTLYPFLRQLHRKDWNRTETYEQEQKKKNCCWCDPKSRYYQGKSPPP
jgi:transposase-like protein